MRNKRFESYPSLFVSHGAPTLALDDCEATRFLKKLGTALQTPKAILVVSAHFDRHKPTVSSGATPKMIYDFGGFQEALYRVTYPAPGDPELAERIVDLLEEAGYQPDLDDKRGFDHGTWVPLVHMFPGAEIPVVQLSISMGQSPKWHYKMGQALASLRKEGILIIGSGSASHNLRALMSGEHRGSSQTPSWVSDFTAWINDKVDAGDHEAVLAAVTSAPEGRRNHPSLDHIHPLFFALGAGILQNDAIQAPNAGKSRLGKRLHASTTYSIIAMDIYAFGDPSEIALLESSLAEYSVPEKVSNS